MKLQFRLSGCAALAAAILPLSAAAQAVRVGAAAPDFTATDSNGKTEALDQFKGKYVVLEWHNQGCPYTAKHYTSGNMQALQKEWTAKGVVWFTVISSAPGHDGYMTASAENAYVKKVGAGPTAILLDSQGKVGHLYDAAIDDKPTTELSDIKGAKNYVSDALTEAMAGRPVATSYTRPYGCAVKYAE
jgi:hypothetical protein